MEDQKQNNLREIQEITAAASFFWLALANSVGLLLALLLLVPSLNGPLAPLTYGRWVPLHMDWQLYGWCSLPLMGILLSQFLAEENRSGYWSRLCFYLWSAGLLAGGLSWLSGHASGKLFLNWSGLAGLVFPASLFCIWIILTVFWIRGFRTNPMTPRIFVVQSARGILLLALLSVPILLIYTSNPKVYPPINPNSGGATGHSLLASTLGIVFIMGILPSAGLNLQPVNRKSCRRAGFIFWIAYAVCTVVYLSIDHGNASNYSLNQIFGLGSLLVWPCLVWFYWIHYKWNSASKEWLFAFLAWWALLVVDGWYIFLPGILDVLKFTNALVGHSHLAMAGMVTSINMVILGNISGSPRTLHTVSSKPAFLSWNVGCGLYVVTMTLQGWREGASPEVLFAGDSTTTFYYLSRMLAGILMLAASCLWIAGMFRTTQLKPYNYFLITNEKPT